MTQGEHVRIDALTDPTERAELAQLLRKRAGIRGEAVAISLFFDEIPPAYAGKAVEPCAIVREAMDFGNHVYVDAQHHACLAGAWQAGFIDPPPEISSGKYLAVHTDFFTEEGAFNVKNGDNVLPQGTVRAIGAAPLDQVPDDVAIDEIVVVCEPAVASMIGGVRVAIDGVPPRGAAGTSLCGDLFALPYHDPNVIISTGDVGGRMFNKIKPTEMFVIIPSRFAHMIPAVLGSRPDLTGLLDSIKPGYAAEREAKRVARAAAGAAISWTDDARQLLADAPESIRDFAAPTLEEYAREHGQDTVTVQLIEEQMATVGMTLDDVRALADAPPSQSDTTSSDSDAGVELVDMPSDMPSGPVSAAASAVIAATPTAVWTVLSDVGRWTEWYPDIRDVRGAPESIRQGDEFSFKTGPVAVKAHVDTASAGVMLRFAGKSRGSSSVYRFTLDSVSSGTRVTLAQTTDGLAAKTMRGMLQKIANDSTPAWLAALKLRVES
jgi:uncharacterized protein (DUF169 family)